jgi:hypothetical protein
MSLRQCWQKNHPTLKELRAEIVRRS